MLGIAVSGFWNCGISGVLVVAVPVQSSEMGTNGIDGIDSSLKSSEEVGGSNGSAVEANKYSGEGLGAEDVKRVSGRRRSVLEISQLKELNDSFPPRRG